MLGAGREAVQSLSTSLPCFSPQRRSNVYGLVLMAPWPFGSTCFLRGKSWGRDQREKMVPWVVGPLLPSAGLNLCSGFSLEVINSLVWFRRLCPHLALRPGCGTVSCCDQPRCFTLPGFLPWSPWVWKSLHSAYTGCLCPIYFLQDPDWQPHVAGIDHIL